LQNQDLRGRLEGGESESGLTMPGVPIAELEDLLSYHFAGESIPLYQPQLPEKFTTLSQAQYDAVCDIVYGLTHNKVVVLDAPTGSGKTVIAETVRQLLGYRGLYVCHSKTLQDQFFTDFPNSGIVKGRSNYLPVRRVAGVTCADCNKHEKICSWCPNVSDCSYERAKSSALRSTVAVINSTYFLTECNGPGRFSGRQLGILDEADTLEQELLRFVEIRITPAMQSRLGIKPPSKITKEDAWYSWVEYASSRVRTQRLRLSPDEQDVKLIRRYKYVENLYSRLSLLAEGLENKDWIYTGGKSTPDISFKPVVVDRLGRNYIWGHCGKFLVMSASIISPSVLLEDLGYDGEFSTINMDSSFDIKNRTVKVTPVANMSRAANERTELADGIQRIAERHPTDRILLHTVSYDLATWLTDELVARNLGRRILTYKSASERDSTVSEYRNTEGAILVSPSLDRGVDFRDEDCRVNVICKVPFPYLGDKQVSERLYSRPNGQTWYNVQTVRTIVQMTGRGTRHQEDYSVNYILDKQFSGLWSKARGLFPQWWKDSLDWRDNLARAK
jgi:Rad3-related DNA helicase